jgi:hypothetical protein
VEFCTFLSGNDQDYFPAVWMLPQEHNLVSTANYWEVDIDEGGNDRTSTDPGYVSVETGIRWVWNGSTYIPTTINNTQSAQNFGANIDRTKPHVFGASYDPTGKVLQYWLDGQKQFAISTAANDTEIHNNHYYLIMSAESHGLLKPYSMYIKYFSAWHP